jgi:hypothetical protein
MQIGGENIENMFVNMMLEKKPLKRHKSKNTSLDALFSQKWDKNI